MTERITLLAAVVCLQWVTQGARVAATGEEWALAPWLVGLVVLGLARAAALRAPTATWLVAGALLGAVLLWVNESATPGGPRVVTPVGSSGLRLLPVVGGLLAVGGAALAARSTVAGGVRGTAAGLGWVALTSVIATIIALALSDLATMVVTILPLAGVLVLHLRRPVLAIPGLVAAAAAAALAPATVVAKVGRRMASTLWGSGPFDGTDDQVARDLWALAAAGLTGRGDAVQVSDFRRATDDDIFALLVERHGAAPFCLATILAVGAAGLALRIAASAPPWRPDARAAPVAVVAVALVPAAWKVAATLGIAPLMGVSSPLVYEGGVNLALAAMLLGIVVGTPADARVNATRAGLRPAALAGILVAVVGTAGTLAAGVLLASSGLARTNHARVAVTCDSTTLAPQVNPRLARLAHLGGRATVFDRTGIVPLVLDGQRGTRVPFAPAVVPLVGDTTTPGTAESWRSLHASFPVVELHGCGKVATARDYSSLVPVLTGAATLTAWKATRPDVLSTLDATLTVAVDGIARTHVQEEGLPAALVVVLDGQGRALARATVDALDPDPRRVENRFLEVGPRGAGIDLAGRLPLPPASTAKTLVALAALDAGLPHDFHTDCEALHGEGNMGAARLGLHGRYTIVHDFPRARPHGRVTVATGIAYSCNVNASRQALELGQARLEAAFRGLEFERPSVDDEVYAVTRAGFGQGVEATVLQVARAYTALVRGSPRAVACDEYWLEGQAGPTCRVLRSFEAADVAVVREGMRAAVYARGGTARTAAAAGVNVWAKTGTGDWVLDGRPATVAWTASVVEVATGEHFVVVVAIPGSRSRTGGEVAAPLAAKVTALLAARARGGW